MMELQIGSTKLSSLAPNEITFAPAGRAMSLAQLTTADILSGYHHLALEARVLPLEIVLHRQFSAITQIPQFYRKNQCSLE
jgi:hypothetical protein